MELGKIVKKLREKKGLSQDELAFRTNTSAANISRIENA
ncbi:helix-turn-helix domain-containing protein, partial [Pararhizobium sp.]